MLLKQNSLSPPRNLALVTYRKLLMFLTKLNLIYLLYSTVQKCCLLLYLIKHICLLKTFLRTLFLMTQVCLTCFSSKSKMKLHISLTPKLVKKVKNNLDLSKACGPDCIPVVILKNCEPQLSYVLADLFIMYLMESFSPDCSKVSSVVPVLGIYYKKLPPC